MKKQLSLLTGLTWLYVFVFLVSCSKTPSVMHERIMLKENWRVQQAEKINSLPGAVISGKDLNVSTWYEATVPSTIMGVLTQNGLYPDLFMADSILNVDRDQFNKSWWYRTTFTLPSIAEEQHVMLNFDGISYYANIWLNGVLVASRDSVFGTFRRFEFDITSLVKDSVNVLAVEVFQQKPGDFGHGFVDWNPAPPDQNMGLWREVYVQITGDVALKNTFVKSDVNTNTLEEASLTITTDVVNYSNRAVSGVLTGRCEDFEFSFPVHLKANETKQVILTPAEISVLHVEHPRLWWCNDLGDPNLYHLKIDYITNKTVSDARDITFGIREIEAYITATGHKGFKLNGREVLIKGGGWTDDIFLRNSDEYNEIQVQYVKHMNLNTIRFENIWGTTPHIYELCDKYGILVMVGWSCQWEWEAYLGKACDNYGGIKSKEDMDLMVESLEHQIRYLQNHPAIFVWLVGSDMIPRPALEERYRELIAKIDDRPYLASASKRKSTVSGPTGVKMNGPYNYVGPSYWYIDSVNGGAYGFNTETGPGPQIPVLETIERMIPEDKLWPINPVWNFHCNPPERFGDLSIFNGVLNQRYGYPSDLADYLKKANVQGYEAMKGMFEAFRVNRPNTTGIIQWMLNSAWPSFYWQLYDYYLLPTSAYYAAKKANEPLQLLYNYGNNTVYAANGTLNRYENTKARIKLVDMQGRELLSEELIFSLDANKSVDVFKLPRYNEVIFLSLSLLDDQNNQVTSNFYWLSGKQDIYDWGKTTWFYTPLKTVADFRQLNYLPAAEVDLSIKAVDSDNQCVIEVKLANTSSAIAFFMNLTLKDEHNQTIFPVFWDDNYLSLLPNESVTLSCRIPGKQQAGKDCTLVLSGWNIDEQLIRIVL